MDQSGNLLGALSVAISGRVWAAVNDEFGYGGEEAAVIIMLGAQPMSVGSIAAAIERSPSATVRLIDRLVADGHVSRGPSALDGRVVLASLTPGGEARRLRALSARDRVLRDATRTLDDGDRAVLAGVLQTMLSGLVDTPIESYRICRLCDEDSCVPRGCPVEERYEQLTDA